MQWRVADELHQPGHQSAGRLCHLCRTGLHGRHQARLDRSTRARRFLLHSIYRLRIHRLCTLKQNDIDTGPGLVFVVYPEAIATMTGSTFWSMIFFFLLITLGKCNNKPKFAMLATDRLYIESWNMVLDSGLDSTFGGLEAMITGLCDEYPNLLGRRRELFVGVLLVFIYLCALPTTTYVTRKTGMH